MIYSKCKDRRQHTHPFGRSTARVMGLVLIAVWTIGKTTGAAEQPQVTASAGPNVTIAEDASTRKTRRSGVIARASADSVASTDRRRKRSPRRESGRRAGRAKKESNAKDATIHLHLSGSYELNFGNDRFVRGEGSTTIELGRAAAEELRIGIGQRLRGAAPAGKDFLKAVAALPGTLKSTSEILNSLSDPETQKALRQVEQLLRLLPQSSPKPESQK